MYKRLSGRHEIKWNVKDEYGKIAMSDILGIPIEDINEDDFIEVSSEQAQQIQERYRELKGPLEES